MICLQSKANCDARANAQSQWEQKGGGEGVGGVSSEAKQCINAAEFKGTYLLESKPMKHKTNKNNVNKMIVQRFNTTCPHVEGAVTHLVQ